MNKTKELLRFYLFNLYHRNYKKKKSRFVKRELQNEKISNNVEAYFHNLHEDSDVLKH